jgi:uncharacterized membrane protein
MFMLWTTLAAAAALGSALIGGVFFAFSNFVMKALAQLPAANGIAAMQAINRTVLNPVFLGVFAGTALLGSALIVRSLLAWERPGSLAFTVGGALYVFGTFVVTMAFNVPRNDQLATLTTSSFEAAAVWANYLRTWTAWNSIRTVAALATAALIASGIFQSLIDSPVTPRG